MATFRKLAAMALLGLGCLTLIAPAESGDKNPAKFEVRLAEDKPGKDLTEANVEGSTPHKVFLHKEVLLCTKDIATGELKRGHNSHRRQKNGRKNELPPL